jgi:hypothetical protein
MTPARTMILGLVLAGSLLLGVTSAQAANPIQNPSFTEDCSGVPCHWSASVGGLARDTTTFHSSPASAKLSGVSVGGVFNGALVSDCFTLDPGGIYLARFFFLTANTGQGQLQFNYSTTANCATLGGPVSIPGATFFMSGDSSWDSLAVIFAVPGSAVSAQVQLNASSLDPLTIYFDDLELENLTAVTFTSARATRTAKGVLVRWRTGTEVDLLGFQVYRSRGHSWRRITHALIAAKGSVSGASYRFLDKTARRGVAYRYRIKALNRDGASSWFGPVRST